MIRAWKFLPLTVILLAGCTSLPVQQGQQEQPNAIQIDGPTCQVGGQPCSAGPFTRFAGSGEVRLTVENTAEKPIRVMVGNNGRELMISKCNSNLVSISDGGFDVTIVGPSTRKNPSISQEITVKEDQRLIATWSLNILADERTISRLGNSCPLEFELTFIQKNLRTAEQVQLKAIDDVPDASTLDTQTEMERPVKLKIESPSAIVVAKDRQLVARAYFQNVGDGRITNAKKLSAVTGTGGTAFTSKSCDTDTIRMFGEGPRSGQSYRRSCGFGLPAPGKLGSQSVVEWVEFRGTYRYEMPLGTKIIELKPSQRQGGGS